MTDLERFAQRLAANGADVPEAMVPLLALMAAPMLAGLDALAATDFGTTEPFDPARHLDAERGRGAA